MPIAAATSLICAAAFAALFLFTLARGKPSREGGYVLAASALTAAWAPIAGFGGLVPGLAPALETAQALVWLALLGALLRPESLAGWKLRARRIALLAGALAGALALADDLAHWGAASLVPSQILARAALAVSGLLLVENLYRNTEQKRLWNVVPLCIAIGGFFSYGLFLYSTALLTGTVNPLFAEARPAATLLSAPFLALTLARNRDWRIDHHVSRRVVFHAFTLVVSGGFLLAVAVLGAALHQTGGNWGPAAQAIALFGSLLVLALVLSSGGIKARLNYLVSRNFFSLRYDYRVEWMNFIDILSSGETGENLRQRVIRAMANIVDAPKGALWLIDEDTGFRPAGFLNLRLAADLVEPAGSEFVAGFRGGQWIQVLDGAAAGGTWRADGAFWLAVPLPHQGRLIGFIVLSHPRAPLDLNWESYDLLRAVARQAASYICEERAAQLLADARGLEDYGKRFAFVGHDIKNLASQLKLLAMNARRYGHDAEFRADAFKTIETAAGRMNKLLQQLNARESSPIAAPAPVEAANSDGVIAEVAGALSGTGVAIHVQSGAPPARVAIATDNLRSALTHLISNAIEASPKGGAVAIRSLACGPRLMIEIADRGCGMTAEFIQDELFRPFRTTKAGGSGIGAYQTRALIRAAGGELDVISTPGAGTTMRVFLPLASEGAVSSAA